MRRKPKHAVAVEPEIDLTTRANDASDTDTDIVASSASRLDDLKLSRKDRKRVEKQLVAAEKELAIARKKLAIQQRAEAKAAAEQAKLRDKASAKLAKKRLKQAKRRGRGKRLSLALLAIVLLGGVGASGFVLSQVDTSHTKAAASATANSSRIMSVRRAPQAWRSVLLDDAIATSASIRAEVDDIRATATAACVEISSRGSLLIAKDVNSKLIPASTQKLLIGFGVLNSPNPVASLRTSIFTTSAVANGTVTNLYVQGGGDPLLSTADFRASVDSEGSSVPFTKLESLADDIVAKGVRHITSSIIANDSLWDNERSVSSWKANYVTSGNVGPVGALTVNDGFTDFAMNIASSDPAVTVAQTLQDLLILRGVDVGAPSKRGAIPNGSVKLTDIAGAPIEDVVKQMLVYSDNNTAEALLRSLAVVAHPDTQATRLLAIAQLQDILSAHDIDRATVSLVDGSGLDRGNRVSCSAIIKAVQADKRLLSLTSVGGVSGTLRDRFTLPSQRSRVHAKTGSLEGVSGLVGAVDVDSFAHNQLQIAVIANGVSSTDGAKNREDSLVAAILSTDASIPAACLIGPPTSNCSRGK